jgi:hypothetical protein
MRPTLILLQIIVGVFNAISSGLLIYAALVDLLAEDFLSEEAQHTLVGKDRTFAFIYVLLGAAGMVRPPLRTLREIYTDFVPTIVGIHWRLCLKSAPLDEVASIIYGLRPLSLLFEERHHARVTVLIWETIMFAYGATPQSI